jgi:hypothetical protein
VRYRVSQHAVDSTRIQAKVWPEAASEPAPWTVDVFDSQPELQNTAGSFALDIYNFQGTGHIFVDDMLITQYPNTVSAPRGAPAHGVGLSAPWPNPVSGSARVVCSLPEPRRASVAVFDASGRRVSTLFDGVLQSGRTTFEWVLLGENGRRLPAGVYLVRLEAGGVTAVRRAVLVN